MSKLLGAILMGVILIFLGIKIIIHPRFYDFKGEYFNLTGYNVPLGLFMVVLGILFIWTELRRKRKNK